MTAWSDAGWPPPRSDTAAARHIGDARLQRVGAMTLGPCRMVARSIMIGKWIKGALTASWFRPALRRACVADRPSAGPAPVRPATGRAGRRVPYLVSGERSV